METEMETEMGRQNYKLSKIPPRCDTTVTVLSWKDIVVQAPEDSSWYAASMKTAGTVT